MLLVSASEHLLSLRALHILGSENKDTNLMLRGGRMGAATLVGAANGAVCQLKNSTCLHMCHG